jgi:glutamyl-tRNA reductase
MNFHLIGVNHRSAPVDVRERLAIPERRLPEALEITRCYRRKDRRQAAPQVTPPHDAAMLR